MPHDGSPVPGRRPDIWLPVLLGTSVLTLTLAAYGLSHGLTETFPHLFYIPIILAIYRYERDGFYFSLLLASLYIGMVYLFVSPEIALLTQGTVQFVTLVGIAAIIFYLVSHLRDREERYHSIFRNSQAGVILINRRNLRILEANRRAAEILECGPGDLDGTPLRLFWKDGAEVEVFLGRLEEDGAVSDHAATFTSARGVRRHVVISAGALSGDDAVCTVVDVTERRRTELLLRSAAELSGMLVRERDAHSLLRKACANLGGMREGLVVGVWQGRGERIAPFAISDENYLHLFSDRSMSRLIRRAYETREIVSLEALGAGGITSGSASFGDFRAIPMMAGSDVLGVLAVAHTSDDRLNDEEVGLLTALANDLASTLRLSELEDEKREAYAQIDKNIEQFAILGDHIRNPLQVIVGLACMEENRSAEKILEQVYTIHGIVGRLDSGWIESAAIRDYLRRHP
ncbi:PAS domain-containing protein [Methanoculleus sp. 7T]|uniref:PAS domain-containing protein n=1 Tax=Methanoculleus sp. 7T TaxID=2937282 RepID=UPI0020C0251E|nr:PAS domain-containing protein [Methanoculleus sp. 7T]MCK8518347.1 PAS domain-containing protein [Methanoculleus sp. 7T]